MEHDKRYIETLLDKFMEGKTSLEEEKVLEDYFTSAEDLPSEWGDYRSMFLYLYRGMKGEPVPAEPLPSVRRIFFPLWARTLAAACFIALFLTVGLIVKNRGAESEVLSEVDSLASPAEMGAQTDPASQQQSLPAANCESDIRPAEISGSSRQSVRIAEASQGSQAVRGVKAAQTLNAPVSAYPAVPHQDQTPERMAESRQPTGTITASDESGRALSEAELRAAVIGKVREAMVAAAGEKLRAAALDAAMKGAGFVLVKNEDGTEKYYEENTIKYIEL